MGSKPRNLLQQLLGPKQDQQVLFSGLRVRMGVVTGEVMRGQEVKSSDLYRRAQGTCEFGGPPWPWPMGHRHADLVEGCAISRKAEMHGWGAVCS